MNPKTLSHSFRFSLLTLALASGFAHAEGEGSGTELQTVTVKGANLSTHRVTTKKLDETTSTDMKDVLFNEPSVSFGGGNGTSQWVTVRGMGQDQIDVKWTTPTPIPNFSTTTAVSCSILRWLK